MAEPSTSARSQAAMATSARIHSTHEIRRWNMARQAWARSMPVTMPSRAEKLWRRMAITFDITSTQSRR
jgi:hypothetical protein